jgi:hypothetical protein
MPPRLLEWYQYWYSTPVGGVKYHSSSLRSSAASNIKHNNKMAKKNKKTNTTVKLPVTCRAPRKMKYTKKPKKPKKFQVAATDVTESDRLFKVVVRGLPIAWKRPARGRNGNTYNPSKADQDKVQLQPS